MGLERFLLTEPAPMRKTGTGVRGFSILEAMISMVVLMIGLVGAMAAFQRGAVESRLGQNRQQKMTLADAALQRLKLQDKATLFTGLPAQPASNIATVAVGTGPWVRDPTTAVDPLDFSRGAYFTILPDGTITPVAVAGNPACNAVPPGTLCREVYLHNDGPFAGSNIRATGSLPAGVRVATAWVRISRKTAPNLPAEIDLVLNQVVIQ